MAQSHRALTIQSRRALTIKSSVLRPSRTEPISTLRPPLPSERGPFGLDAGPSPSASRLRAYPGPAPEPPDSYRMGSATNGFMCARHWIAHTLAISGAHAGVHLPNHWACCWIQGHIFAIASSERPDYFLLCAAAQNLHRRHEAGDGVEECIR